MRSRTALAAAAVAAVAVAVPARAAAPAALAGQIIRVQTTSGGLVAHADITLPRNVRLLQPPVLTTRGHWVAAFVEWQADPHLAWGAVVPDRRIGVSTFGLRYGDLTNPGRYRIHLASDGMSVLTLRVSGLRRSINVVATTLTHGVATGFPVGANTAGGHSVRGPARDSRTGVPLPARYFALVVRQASVATPAGAGYFRACVVPAGDPCEVESRPTGDGLPAVTPAGGAAGDLRFYYDDVAPVTDPVSHAAPAQVDAILENAGIAVDGAEAAVFVLLDRGSFHP